MATKSTKNAKNQKGTGSKKAPKAAANAVPEYEQTRAEAIELEQTGKWGEAAIAWKLVADVAGTAKQKKEAAGRAAAAKVRAAEVVEAKPLEEALAGSDAAAVNEASWEGALPEPGYEPPAGTGEEPTGSGEETARDESPAEDGTGAQADEHAAPTNYVDPEFAKALAARKARKPSSDPRLPAVGTVIVKKDRHGTERVRCTIVEGGVEYGGTTYKSISSAAQAAAKDLGLASKTQDGYSFWGLKKGTPRPAKKNPVEAVQAAWERYHERAAAAAKAAEGENRTKVQGVLQEHLTALTAIAAQVA
jgi:hypothetical protein